MASEERAPSIYLCPCGSEWAGEDILHWLHAQGLHVVGAADKAVLDVASRPVSEHRLDYSYDDWCRAVYAAELARREALRGQ